MGEHKLLLMVLVLVIVILKVLATNACKSRGLETRTDNNAIILAGLMSLALLPRYEVFHYSFISYIVNVLLVVFCCMSIVNTKVKFIPSNTLRIRSIVLANYSKFLVNASINASYIESLKGYPNESVTGVKVISQTESEDEKWSVVTYNELDGKELFIIAAYPSEVKSKHIPDEVPSNSIVLSSGPNRYELTYDGHITLEDNIIEKSKVINKVSKVTLYCLLLACIADGTDTSSISMLVATLVSVIISNILIIKNNSTV